mgnify:CR=1 FL=1
MATKKTGPYVIVRCAAAGVHAGNLASRKGTEVELSNTRRIWYWSGAATLSELALTGPKKLAECKFSVVLPSITLLDVCEIIPCSDTAATVIAGVPEWRA